MKLYTLDKEANPFPNQFSEIVHVKKITDIKRDGVLILWGGSDLWPGLYNERPNRYVYTYKASDRDLREIEAIHHCLKHDIKMIGICRGAQLACALSGGTLYQHIQGGHHGDHEVETFDGKVMHTSSCHHQALNLEGVGHELLAWDKDRITVAFTDKEVTKVIIPEVVLLTETKTLAIQGHPEWMHKKDVFVKWCANLLQTRFA